MPSIALVAACVMALSLVAMKLAGVSAHLPPTVAPADIVAVNKANALALRETARDEESSQLAFMLRGTEAGRVAVSAR